MTDLMCGHCVCWHAGMDCCHCGDDDNGAAFQDRYDSRDTERKRCGTLVAPPPGLTEVTPGPLAAIEDRCADLVSNVEDYGKPFTLKDFEEAIRTLDEAKPVYRPPPIAVCPYLPFTNEDGEEVHTFAGYGGILISPYAYEQIKLNGLKDAPKIAGNLSALTGIPVIVQGD